MNKKNKGDKRILKNYERVGYIGIIVITLGITFTTSLREYVGSIGIVFIAIGGLFFIFSMNEKKKEDKKNKQ